MAKGCSEDKVDEKRKAADGVEADPQEPELNKHIMPTDKTNNR